MDDVTVNPLGNPRGLMRTNKRKLQEGQIQAIPKVFFERLKTHVQPLAGQHWTAHLLTTAYKNAFPTHVSELLVARLRLLDQLRWVVTMNSTDRKSVV